VHPRADGCHGLFQLAKLRPEYAPADKPGKPYKQPFYLLYFVPYGTVVLAKSGDAYFGSYFCRKYAWSHSVCEKYAIGSVQWVFIEQADTDMRPDLRCKG
jgi:hypothetical protein